MILKKPYAFFIKYFRLIHLLLTFFGGIIAVYLYKDYGFFNAYIANGYRATSTFQLIETYLPFYLFFIIAFVIILLLACILLLKYKNKPYLLYLSELIYIIVLLGIFIYARYLFGILVDDLIASTLSRTVRDILLIAFIPFPFFLIITFLRTIGFNIKQFEFNNDIKQFNVGLEDSEEVEISFGDNSYKYKRNIRKYIRELKYYVLENKIFVIICSSLIVVVFFIFLFMNRTPNYNRTYGQGRSFVYKDLSITVEDTIITNLNSKGQIIKDGKHYVVVKVKVQNLANNYNNIDFNIFKLMDGNHIIDPSPNLIGNFTDFVSKQNGSFIGINKTIEYGIVYEIDTDNVYHKYKIQLDNGFVTYKNNVYNKNIFISLNPDINNNNINVKKYNIGDAIKFQNNALDGIELLISDFEIGKSFTYKYIKTVNNVDKEYTGIVSLGVLQNKQDNYIISLKYSYNNSGNTKYNNFNSFVNNYGFIEYNIGYDIHQIDFKNVTPDDYHEGVFLEAPKDITLADGIKFIISLRNERFEITLK